MRPTTNDTADGVDVRVQELRGLLLGVAGGDGPKDVAGSGERDRRAPLATAHPAPDLDERGHAVPDFGRRRRLCDAEAAVHAARSRERLGVEVQLAGAPLAWDSIPALGRGGVRCEPVDGFRLASLDRGRRREPSDPRSSYLPRALGRPRAVISLGSFLCLSYCRFLKRRPLGRSQEPQAPFAANHSVIRLQAMEGGGYVARRNVGAVLVFDEVNDLWTGRPCFAVVTYRFKNHSFLGWRGSNTGRQGHERLTVVGRGSGVIYDGLQRVGDYRRWV